MTKVFVCPVCKVDLEKRIKRLKIEPLDAMRVHIGGHFNGKHEYKPPKIKGVN